MYAIWTYSIASIECAWSPLPGSGGESVPLVAFRCPCHGSLVWLQAKTHKTRNSDIPENQSQFVCFPVFSRLKKCKGSARCNARSNKNRCVRVFKRARKEHASLSFSLKLLVAYARERLAEMPGLKASATERGDASIPLLRAEPSKKNL